MYRLDEFGFTRKTHPSLSKGNSAFRKVYTMLGNIEYSIKMANRGFVIFPPDKRNPEQNGKTNHWGVKILHWRKHGKNQLEIAQKRLIKTPDRCNW
jgi:hypothetical protein